ncbi:MAG: translation initiation factor IF-2 subunit beta [Candidatus Aenigmatarchaeota archaeon]|nr:MAG: translation initiation factor IF-2 subunit beta [Candidatus Aenigmarchaeota archaeon]
MQDYETLLKRAEQKIARASAHERFEMPDAVVSNQGNMTVVVNFAELARTLRREAKHLMKYLTREMAVPGDMQGARASFQGKFSKDQLQAKLQKYANEFVFCACGKPDTEFVREDRLLKLKCQACGVKRVIRDIG